MNVLYCDVCKSELDGTDLALKFKAGPRKGREAHLCRSHADRLFALLDGRPGDDAAQAPARRPRKPRPGAQPAAVA
jgi:hypothetical protein